VFSFSILSSTLDVLDAVVSLVAFISVSISFIVVVVLSVFFCPEEGEGGSSRKLNGGDGGAKCLGSGKRSCLPVSVVRFSIACGVCCKFSKTGTL